MTIAELYFTHFKSLLTNSSSFLPRFMLQLISYVNKEVLLEENIRIANSKFSIKGGEYLVYKIIVIRNESYAFVGEDSTYG